MLVLGPPVDGTILSEGGVSMSFDDETRAGDLVDIGVAAESMLSKPKLGCLLALLDSARGLGFS